MRLVIATDGLNARGGIHSYLDAVLPELVALEHEVHVVAPVFARREAVEGAGGVPHNSYATVPAGVDGVIAFFDFSALEARAAYPLVPLVGVSHGPWYAQDVPTALAEPCAVVALSDTSYQRLIQGRAAGDGTPVVRLTQPAEFRTPPPENLPRAEPRHAVFVAHRLTSRREQIANACHARGITPTFIGGFTRDEEVLDEIAAADFVGGIGRVVVEAMALGRPAVVLDEVADGRWVTPDTYAELEAAGFFLVPAGPPAEQDISAIIDGYRPEYGRAGRGLALQHHAPAAHSARLVEMLRAGSGPRGPVNGDTLRGEARRRREAYGRFFAARTEAWASVPSLRAAMDERRRGDVLAAEVSDLHARLDALTTSASWRITAPLRHASDLVRRVRDR